MYRVAWPELMRLGLTRLGLPPDVFWNLTPVELMLMAGGGDGDGREALTRSGLEDLVARFPDAPATKREIAE